MSILPPYQTRFYLQWFISECESKKTSTAKIVIFENSGHLPFNEEHDEIRPGRQPPSLTP
jgi:hypothetical protein